MTTNFTPECALEDECFISSELRKDGKTWTFPILLWLTKLPLLRQVQFSILKHKIIRVGTRKHYLQEQAKFSMRGGPIRECAVLTRISWQ